ncbi:hypothetical protein JM946_00130 [Steroidobacter sp. S1-65]|uniref:Uncharacterized protein n=1 Tax=Steroidobacter gossypii TaxID=2805490 RepID=A0ABS1WQ69_9GAMM|nr:hypothetical protein [Steroidobacter gossypii]MBM0103126.1 hypothetical protein [Steroidobacter gossypii]
MSDFEPPIENLDAFDIVGERLDGGVDLVVVRSGPLDDSPETPGLLRRKIENHLREAVSEDFRSQFGTESPVRISISCAHPISSAASGLINVLRTDASNHGMELELVKDMA